MTTPEHLDRTELPTEAVSFEGLPFDPTAAVWTLRDTATEFDVCWPQIEAKVTVLDVVRN